MHLADYDRTGKPALTIRIPMPVVHVKGIVSLRLSLCISDRILDRFFRCVIGIAVQQHAINSSRGSVAACRGQPSATLQFVMSRDVDPVVGGSPVPEGAL
jgi:hypothetical protein